MIDDIFCKIINKELPADIVMEGKGWLAFRDIHPQAPVHVLIVPKKHIMQISEDPELVEKLFSAAEKVASKLGLEKGYRLIVNKGEHGGQLVPHFHIHLLGGRRLGAKIILDPKNS